MNDLLPIIEGEEALDDPSRELITVVRSALAIHHNLLCRMLDGATRPTLILAAALEDAGNRYLDFAEHLQDVARG